jgi:hypothetical protein
MKKFLNEFSSLMFLKKTWYLMSISEALGFWSIITEEITVTMETCGKRM